MNFLTVLLPLACACGVTTDDRPRSTEYVTKAVLAETCASAQCHSSFANEHGYALDSVESVKHTLRYEVEFGDNELINASFVSQFPQASLAEVADQQALFVPLTRRNGDGMDDVEPMPYDAPMPVQDIRLVLEWMALGAPGACEIPAGETICGFNNSVIVACGDDGEYVYVRDANGECL